MRCVEQTLGGTLGAFPGREALGLAAPGGQRQGGEGEGGHRLSVTVVDRGRDLRQGFGSTTARKQEVPPHSSQDKPQSSLSSGDKMAPVAPALIAMGPDQAAELGPFPTLVSTPGSAMRLAVISHVLAKTTISPLVRVLG